MLNKQERQEIYRAGKLEILNALKETAKALGWDSIEIDTIMELEIMIKNEVNNEK
jgi:hypothetical protein